jgi:hypothetical protein
MKYKNKEIKKNNTEIDQSIWVGFGKRSHYGITDGSTHLRQDLQI